MLFDLLLTLPTVCLSVSRGNVSVPRMPSSPTWCTITDGLKLTPRDFADIGDTFSPIFCDRFDCLASVTFVRRSKVMEYCLAGWGITLTLTGRGSDCVPSCVVPRCTGVLLVIWKLWLASLGTERWMTSIFGTLSGYWPWIRFTCG